MMMTEKKANAIAKMRVAQLRPMARPRRSPNMAIHVSSNTLSLPAKRGSRKCHICSDTCSRCRHTCMQDNMHRNWLLALERLCRIRKYLLMGVCC